LRISNDVIINTFMDAKDLQEMIEAGPPEGNRLATKRATISMPWGLYADALEAILAESYSSLSDYVHGLIRDDKLRRDQAKTAQTAVAIAIPQPNHPAPKRPTDRIKLDMAHGAMAQIVPLLATGT
jgi:Arc/MetJ-type ribon-helix-helix transcriptional regulator